jgi:hypothetical protein
LVNRLGTYPIALASSSVGQKQSSATSSLKSRFSSHYDEAQWNISALTPANHVHSPDSLDWHKIHTPKKNALKFQEQYVRKLVRGANTFDSVIFEIHTARHRPW